MTEQSTILKPSSEQLWALENYRAIHGRSWKTDLWNDWMRAEYDGNPDSHLLQQIRNQFGPSWLHKLDLNRALLNAGLNPGRKVKR